MKDTYLKVTVRKGRAMAAYLYLPRASGEKSQRTEKAEEGILVDYGKDGLPIGIEITAPRQVSLEGLNRVLSRSNVRLMKEEDLAPLMVA